MPRQTLEFFDTINPNTEFIEHGYSFWPFYASLIAFLHTLTKLVLSCLPGHCECYAMTVVNIFHAITTFYSMHWVKGANFTTPFWTTNDWGKCDNLTWWEQLDNGKQNTIKRKILIVVPIIIACLASTEAGWTINCTYVNFVTAAILVISKMPILHRVRLFGINK